MELAAILRRQWILTCVLAVLTLVGVAGALVKLGSTYQSTGSVVFLTSKDSAKVFGGNPYLGFNSALNQTADVVRYEVMDIRTANALADRGYSSSYMISDAIDTAGPVLLIQITGHNKTNVEHTLYGVLSEISVKLNSLQAGLTPGNKIRSLVVASSPTATVLVSKKARPLLEVLGLGLIFTIGIPVVVDAVRTRRSSRKATKGDSSSRGEPGRAPVRPGPGSDRPVRPGYGSDMPVRSGHSGDRSDPSGYVGERSAPAPGRPHDSADRNEVTQRSAGFGERRRPDDWAKATRRP
jgi:hypothetical protein